MKMLLVAVALCAAIATPALAAGSSPYAQADDVPTIHRHAVMSSRAQAMPATRAQLQPSWNDTQIRTPNDVFFGGEYLGADPDPNVRLSLIYSYMQRD